VPRRCEDYRATCGTLDDGCGTKLACGVCTTPGDACVDYQCACVAARCLNEPVLSGTRLGSGGVRLTWTWGGTADAYELERSADDVTFVAAANPAGTASQADDPGAPRGDAWYRLRAVDALGPGPWSNVAMVPRLPTVANAWTTVGHDIGHTGYNALETGRPPLTPRWSITTPLQPSPVVCDGRRAYFSFGGGFSQNNTLLAVDVADAGVAWSHLFPGAFSVGQPAVFEDQVFIAHCNHAPDTKLWSFDANNGVNFSVTMTAQ
jgi:hypothetical protein